MPKKRELAVPKLSEEELAALASDDAKIREMSLLAVLDKSLPALPKDYSFKMRERRDVELAMHACFELVGGVPRMALWAKENPTEFFRLYMKLLPQTDPNTATAATQVIINTNLPRSALADVELTTLDARMYDEPDDE